MNKYQPARTDLLINTDWGIPRDSLTKEEARDRKLLRFHDRWVTKEEKKRLKDERNSYFSIRAMGFLLMLPALLVVLNIGQIARGTFLSITLAIASATVALVCGIGLIRYARFARYLAVLIFISFFVLPFTPLFEDEKSAPLLFMLGMMGLYYLLRRTARKIFWPQTEARPDAKKIRAVVRKIIFGVALLVGLSVGYCVYDMSQAKQMAVDACHQAKEGMSLDVFLSKISEKDYKIVQNADYTLIVPKRGMGRNHCMVTHDGQNIAGAQPGSMD